MTEATSWPAVAAHGAARPRLGNARFTNREAN
jgi:hypothetical protein